MGKRLRLLSKKDPPRTPRTVWGIQRGKGGRAGVRGSGGGGLWPRQGSEVWGQIWWPFGKKQVTGFRQALLS